MSHLGSSIWTLGQSPVGGAVWIGYGEVQPCWRKCITGGWILRVWSLTVLPNLCFLFEVKVVLSLLFFPGSCLLLAAILPFSNGFFSLWKCKPRQTRPFITWPGPGLLAQQQKSNSYMGITPTLWSTKGKWRPVEFHRILSLQHLKRIHHPHLSNYDLHVSHFPLHLGDFSWGAIELCLL